MTSLDMAKLKAMVHYIVATIPEEQLGKTKLNKILWFSDREAYLRLGKTISGDTYIRKQRGPVSKNLEHALDELEKDGIVEETCDYRGEYSKYSYHSHVRPENLPFTPDELSILDAQITKLRQMTAKEVSELSHDYTWRMYENGEEIDMVATLAQPGNITPEDVAWALASC